MKKIILWDQLNMLWDAELTLHGTRIECHDALKINLPFPILHSYSNSLIWYKNGLLHCETGPAAQYEGGVKAGGSEEYWVEGKRHRDPYDGPAAQYEGGKNIQYWVDDQLHRNPYDGPAVQSFGGKNAVYWVEGKSFANKMKAVNYWEGW